MSCIIAFVVLTGCGDTSKLEQYYREMNSFNTNIGIITDSIEMIDENDSTASIQIIQQLEKLEDQFNILAEIEVPKNFLACEELADDAAYYMTEAVKLYKEYYKTENYDDTNTVDMARQNYDRAMTRVNYISLILQGNIPEGEGITTEETEINDFEPVVEDKEFIDEELEFEFEEDDYDIIDEANPVN